MFGENGIFGKSYHTMDDKNRIILPKDTNREENDELAYYKENELTFRIYNLKRVKEKIKKYEEKYDSDPTKYEQLINNLTMRIIATGNVDAQYRTPIPKQIVNEYKLQKSLIFHGGSDHLKIFKDEETYNKYVKSLQKRK